MGLSQWKLSEVFLIGNAWVRDDKSICFIAIVSLLWSLFRAALLSELKMSHAVKLPD